MNRERPHLIILPEDREDNNLANGFRQHLQIEDSQIQILPPAGGWTHVRDLFAAEHVKAMRKYPQRYIVLLVDFDRRKDRYDEMLKDVPHDLKDRVFVLGPWHKPEALRVEFGQSVEDIGESLADECVSSRLDKWKRPMLVHNVAELDRLCEVVRGFVVLG